MNTGSRITTVLSIALPVAGESATTDRPFVYDSIESCGGRQAGGGGDTVLAEFADPMAAIECAESIARRLTADAEQEPEVRLGIGQGVVEDDGNAVFGDAVDIASRLSAAAPPGSIVVSGAVHEQARLKSDLAFRRFRPPSGKLPVPAYIVVGEDAVRHGAAFFQELVRRRVFRAAGAYIVLSWLLVQVASIVFPEFDFPDWSMRVLIVLLTVGFPLAMLLAWTVDVTSSGFAVTADSPYSRARGNALRVGIVLVAALLSAGVLWWVWADYLQPTTERQVRAEIPEDPVIAVSRLSKLSGSSELDWLGDGVATLVRNELAESRYVIVVSQSRWEALAAEAASRTQLVDAAQSAGVDYLIGGEYLQAPDGIALTFWIEDLKMGNVLLGTKIDAPDAGGIIGATSELAVVVKRALNLPTRTTVTHYSADFAVENLAAYEAYVAGLGFTVAFDYQQAEESFAAAIALSPEFHMARFRLAEILEATGRTQLAKQELDRIPANAALTERQRLYIEGARHTFIAERDPARSIEVYQELVEKYPYDIEAGQHLADAYWVDFREDESIAVYQDLAELHPYEPTSWMAVGERLLDVGRLAEAEMPLRRFAEMDPDNHYAAALLGNLAQLRGDYTGSVPLYSRSLALRPDFAVALLGLARSRYLLGDIPDSQEIFRQLIEDDGQAAKFRIDAAFDLSGILRGQGRFAESMRPLLALEDEIRDESIRLSMMQSTLAAAELELGNRDRAAGLIESAIDGFPGVPSRYLFARGLLELSSDGSDRVRTTADEIRALALPPDDPDRTEDRAADYLTGMVALDENDLATAEPLLSAAVAAEGYPYAIYELGLAQLRFAQGRLDEAIEMVHRSETARDPGDLRFDLELDRARAVLMRALILDAMGDAAASRDAAATFVQRWVDADQPNPSLDVASELLSAE